MNVEIAIAVFLLISGISWLIWYFSQWFAKIIVISTPIILAIVAGLIAGEKSTTWSNETTFIYTMIWSILGILFIIGFAALATIYNLRKRIEKLEEKAPNKANNQDN